MLQLGNNTIYMSVHGLNLNADCVHHEHSLPFGPIYGSITSDTFNTLFLSNDHINCHVKHQEAMHKMTYLVHPHWLHPCLALRITVCSLLKITDEAVSVYTVKDRRLKTEIGVS